MGVDVPNPPQFVQDLIHLILPACERASERLIAHGGNPWSITQSPIHVVSLHARRVRESEDLRGSVMIVATTEEEIRAMNCLLVPRRLLESVPGDNVARRTERKRKPVLTYGALSLAWLGLAGLKLKLPLLFVCLFPPTSHPLLSFATN